jgi:hypothetical protein
MGQGNLAATLQWSTEPRGATRFKPILQLMARKKCHRARPSGQNRVILLARLSPQEWFSIGTASRGSREEKVLPLHASVFVPSYPIAIPADQHPQSLDGLAGPHGITGG